MAFNLMFSRSLPSVRAVVFGKSRNKAQQHGDEGIPNHPMMMLLQLLTT
jgi:hypothetical protein